ncbi:MAG: ABC transporter permease [Lachnospiraceae bacterium]|nr:ABC transporter permease [Lachnospiraceae bacterium]MBQ9593505.1 ABC transporter permease [Lachnospiraceae bacterium]MBR0152550.1 ABC transporter permease [Lachnospiraceae bacterium]
MKKKSIFESEGFQSLVASLICIVLGLLLGYIVLLLINPAGAGTAIMAVIKNFLNYSKAALQAKNFGNTLVKTAPLLMCALSVLFCYKVGLFNIGAAGQYVIGACISIYAALAWNLPWWLCIILAIAVGFIYGAIVGLLKAYCNVNEVISGIMLNWIGLYMTNMILTGVKESTSPYTLHLRSNSPGSVLPTLGLDKLFSNNEYVSLAIPLAILITIAIKILLDKTKFGYELKATGYNKNAAKYAGMAEKSNIIVTLAIGGALAALGGAFLYLTDYELWECTSSAVPGMGFNGIAAAFLGGLNPVGTIFSSYFIQHITTGGAYVDKTHYSSQISDLISALIIYLCGFVGFMKLVMKRRIAQKQERSKVTGEVIENKEGGKK